MAFALRKILGVTAACAAAFLAYEADAHACHESRICVEIPVHAIDQFVGDFGTSDTVRARGTRVRLIDPDGDTRETYLDDEGCFTFETRHTKGLKLLVYADAYLGVDKNVHIRAFASKPDAMADPPVELLPWRIDLIFVFTENQDDPTVAVVAEGPEALMFGWVLESFQNMDAFGGIEGPQEIRVHTEKGDQLASLGAYASGNFLMLGPLARERKFIAAHELGHWYQDHWTGLPLSVDYDYQDDGMGDDAHALDPDCDFLDATVSEQINDIHGIRSAEWADAALTEGFAQFVASLAFNDLREPDGNGEFQYYKEIDVSVQPSSQEFVEEDNYIVELIGSATASGGTNAWVQNMCPADWDAPLTSPFLGRSS